MKYPQISIFFFFLLLLFFSCLERLQPHRNEIYADELLYHLQNISTQCSGYLKTSFSNATTIYGTKQLLPRHDRRRSHKSTDQRPPSEQLPWQGCCVKNYSGLLKNLLLMISSFFEADI